MVLAVQSSTGSRKLQPAQSTHPKGCGYHFGIRTDRFEMAGPNLERLASGKSKAGGSAAELIGQLVRELDRPVTEVRSALSASITLTKSIVLPFPHGTPKEGWRLKDFVLLKGTTINFNVEYKEEGGVILRRIVLDFEGGSELNGGFWGPAAKGHGAGEPFPEFRADRFSFTEAYSKKTGEAVPYFKMKDYDGTMRKVSYSLYTWLSLHEEDGGGIRSCNKIMEWFARSKGLDARCDGALFKVNFAREIGAIMKNIEKLRLKPGSGGLLDESYNKFGGKVENRSKMADFTLMIGYLLHHGITTGRPDMNARIREMEGRL